MRWNDIDFEKNTVIIQNTRTKVTKAVEKMPKTKSSQRQLFLIPRVSDYLKKLKKRQLEDQLFLGGQYKSNDYVCRYEDGTPLNMTTLNHAFKRILKNNDLPNVRFHDLRHSMASYLHQLGYGAKEIQAWLGHSNISTTMDIYVHLFKETNQEIANGMNELFQMVDMS